METSSMRLFLEVARVGSFAEAARRLDKDPSTVSRGIQQLEASLGARLFQRTTRRLALTDAGMRALQRLEPVVEEVDALLEELADPSPSGTVVITASVAFGQTCIAPLLPQFLAQYPAVGLDLRFTDNNLDLVGDGVDIALRLSGAVDSNYVGRKLKHTAYGVYASPAWLRDHPRPDSPLGLASVDVVTMDLPGHREQWHFRSANGEEMSIDLLSRVKVSTALTLREAAVVGIGPALLADWLAADAVSAGQLVPMFPEHDASANDFDTALWMLYPSRRLIPQRTRAAIAFFTKALAEASADSPLDTPV